MNGLRLRILSSSIIFISLFAALSVKGQDADGREALERALRWEKVVYGNDDPEAIRQALMEKASCYAEAGLPQEALRTLDRIQLYMLDEEATARVLLLKSEYSMEAGDYVSALSYLEESGKATGIPRPKVKKESTAALLSFLPPLGQIYLDKPLEGLGSLMLNAGAAAFTVWQLAGGNWVTGILGGGLMLNETFFKGNMEKNISRVEEVNERNIEKLLKELSLSSQEQ